jgi:serine/threonine protein phosphatase 1
LKFVVGDIHGEYTKLRLLIDNMLRYDQDGEFIFIGDYLDKGENPLRTIEYLNRFSKDYPCIFLRGNHEYYWEMLTEDHDKYADYLRKYGAANTISSIDKNLSILGAKKMLIESFSLFFSSLINYVELENYIITHSGISPDCYGGAMETIPVEKLLFNRYDFLSTNQRYFGKRVIFGHTGFYAPYYDSYKVGIDTAACYLEEQPLTAFCIESEVLINSNKEVLDLSAIDQFSCPIIPRVKPWRQINN